jgi:opacity protein-like surface antigen
MTAIKKSVYGVSLLTTLLATSALAGGGPHGSSGVHAAGSAYLGVGASGGGYIGLDGSSLAIENSLDNDLNPRGMRLRLGMPIAPMIDVELHVGGGSDSETKAADKFTAMYVGAFLKGYLPIGQRSALFALAGFTGVDLSQRINGQEFSDARSGFSYGFGLETEISQRLDLSADYVSYVRDDGPFAEVSAVNLGIKFYF